MAAYLTPADVAAAWACSPSKVRKLCRSGELRAMRLGSDWRISEQAVEAYEARHTAPPTTADETPKPEPSRRPEVQQPVTSVAGFSLPADYRPVFPHLWEGNEKAALTSQ